VTCLRWTTEAAHQLEAFVSRIREDNVEAAFALAETILNRVAQLENFPGLGRPGVKDDVAEILHIWHRTQDWR
jgi:plasmid stabilization system protein ParE